MYECSMISHLQMTNNTSQITIAHSKHIPVLWESRSKYQPAPGHQAEQQKVNSNNTSTIVHRSAVLGV